MELEDDIFKKLLFAKLHQKLYGLLFPTSLKNCQDEASHSRTIHTNKYIVEYIVKGLMYQPARRIFRDNISFCVILYCIMMALLLI